MNDMDKLWKEHARVKALSPEEREAEAKALWPSVDNLPPMQGRWITLPAWFTRWLERKKWL